MSIYFFLKLFRQYKNDRRFGWIEHSMFVWNMRARGWNKCFPSRNIGHSWSIHCDLCWWLGSWCGWWVTSEFDGVYAIGAMVWRVRRSSPAGRALLVYFVLLFVYTMKQQAENVHEAFRDISSGFHWTKEEHIYKILAISITQDWKLVMACYRCCVVAWLHDVTCVQMVALLQLLLHHFRIQIMHMIQYGYVPWNKPKKRAWNSDCFGVWSRTQHRTTKFTLRYIKCLLKKQFNNTQFFL